MLCNVIMHPAKIFPGVPNARFPSCSYARIPKHTNKRNGKVRCFFHAIRIAFEDIREKMFLTNHFSTLQKQVDGVCREKSDAYQQESENK